MKELTKWDLDRELKQMAEVCTKLKPSTARRKAASLFKKYDEVICYSKKDKEYYEKEARGLKKIVRVLKEQKIYYGNSEESGVVLLTNIEQIDVNKNRVLITTKYNREISLDLGFEYLKDLF